MGVSIVACIWARVWLSCVVLKSKGRVWICVGVRTCNTYCNTLQHATTRYNTPQHEYSDNARPWSHFFGWWRRNSVDCNTLYYTAMHCNAHMMTSRAWSHFSSCSLQTAIHCNTLLHTATYCSTLQHTATHCNILQRTPTNCVAVVYLSYVFRTLCLPHFVCLSVSLMCVSLSLSCMSIAVSMLISLFLAHVSRQNDRFLLQKSPIKETIFCKRDLQFWGRYSSSHELCLTHVSRVLSLSLIPCVSLLSCVSLIFFVCLSHCCRVACPSYASHMGWLRSVGALKLQVSFAKEPYKRDYILQQRPIILRSLLIEATSYLLRLALLLSLIYVVSLLSCLLIISISVWCFSRCLSRTCPVRHLSHTVCVSVISVVWCVPPMFLMRYIGWLRLIDSLKWKVSSAKEPYKRDDILQKSPVILRTIQLIAWGVLSLSRHTNGDVIWVMMSHIRGTHHTPVPFVSIDLSCLWIFCVSWERQYSAESSKLSRVFGLTKDDVIWEMRERQCLESMYSQSHLGWHFRMLFQSSKLKARTSLFTGTWQKRRSSFELWALSFKKWHPKWDWLYIDVFWERQYSRCDMRDERETVSWVDVMSLERDDTVDVIWETARPNQLCMFPYR